MGNEKETGKDAAPKRKALNVNLGVLGHIDSGKTSICRMLSTVTSTASMDKSKESQERGITLDLGFSSFSTDAPEHIQAAGYDAIQWCLVDCPGHASLIRTVIGGAQIIDLCALVIDVNKGIQTQTAECMVVAEILANQLVVILNKIDMLPAEKRKKILDKVIKELRKTFARTKFGEDLPFACISAHPQDGAAPLGADDLINVIKNTLAIPQRDPSGPFMFAFDHAFAIKGQGTVLTGTVLSGAVKPQMGIVVPQLGEAGKGKKVRSLQMFRQPVQEAIQGDRVAMCVAALDAKELERGIVLGEKFPVPMLDAAVCVVDKISYFKSVVNTKSKFHVTLGHQTVMATAHFFCPFPGSSSSSSAPGARKETAPKAKTETKGYPGSKGPTLAMGCGAAVSERQNKWPTSFDFSQSYLHVDELWQSNSPVEYENTDGDLVKLIPESGRLLFELNGISKGEVNELRYDPPSGQLLQQEGLPLGSSLDSRSVIPLKDRDRVVYLLRWLATSCDVPLTGAPGEPEEPLFYVLLVLEKPVMCPLGSLVIGSKLDFDIHSPNCRMAFFGRILSSLDPKDLKQLRLVKMKSKVGVMERVDKQESTLIICKDMFKADSDIQSFVGLKILHESSGAEGILEGSFGQEGHIKVRFKEEIPNLKLDPKGHIKGTERISLFFKKFDFEKTNSIVQ
ncbi:Selenocysteine-specific elongation factor (Elongation factor sec) (Eukaryotic elongation factor [Durusdinium trenchii]|uniref:Selenocysteine-tRNA-specific (MSelB n=2 Tax=Durusdinium trenchii TaxID=1381693 RepID=A0ABP0NQS3_9DINO